MVIIYIFMYSYITHMAQIKHATAVNVSVDRKHGQFHLVTHIDEHCYVIEYTKHQGAQIVE